MCDCVWTKSGIKAKQNAHSNDKTEVILQSRALSTFCVNRGSFNYFENSLGLKVHLMRREDSDWKYYWKCVCKDFVFPGFKGPTLIYLEGGRKKKCGGGVVCVYNIPELNASFLDNYSRLTVLFLAHLIFKAFPYIPLGKHPALQVMGSLYTFLRMRLMMTSILFQQSLLKIKLRSAVQSSRPDPELSTTLRAGTHTGALLTFVMRRSS